MSWLVDVWFRSGKAAYDFLPMWKSLTRAEATEIFRNEIRRTCDIWVAVKEAAIVGYLAIRGSYIDRLYIDPKVQRTSCGTRLLNFAKGLSAEGLQLCTHQENLGARAFYEKHGFRAVRFGMSPAPECVPDVEYHWEGQRSLE